MQKIGDIYKEYKIMPILALHQIRVAAVAMIVCESLDIQVDKDSIAKACLLHDIANIIKFDLTYFPEFNKPEGLEYWQKVKDDYILKYGNDEHEASVRIVKELGLSDMIVHLVDIVEAHHIEKVTNGNDIAEKICLYADNRVTPHGITSLNDRNIEAKNRYKNNPHSFGDDKREFFMKNIQEVENQIFSHSNIKPEDINDESIAPYLEKLQDFSI